MATTHPDAAAPDTTNVGQRHEHASDGQYVKIAVILALITAVEVDTYLHPDLWDPILAPALLGMMAVKFFMVTWFFMHLRDDKPILTWAFYSGAVLAIAVYLAVLFTFNYFLGS
jgi:caa(3)-type oxidase subunit IV